VHVEPLVQADPHPALPGRRLDGLHTAQGGTGDDRADRVGAELVDHAGRFMLAGGRQRPLMIGSAPSALVASVSMTDQMVLLQQAE
jgi:hypothetical protein